MTADAIAMKLGIERTAVVRVRAGIGHALAEAMDEGHCGLPEEELGPLAAKLLEVPAEVIRTALDLELADGTLAADTVEDTPCIFLGGLHRAERAIAGRILDIAAGKPSWPRIDFDKALPWVERRTGLALVPGQADAVWTALASKVSVITGGPGVGKTTIVNAILRILSAKDVEILLCAPTGRAAKRMREATGFEAKTIHRLLEVDPRTGSFKRDRDNPLDCGLLVVDENFDGRCASHALSACGGPRQSGVADRGRRRSATLGRAGTGSSRHHRLGRRAGGPPDRGVPPGGAGARSLNIELQAALNPAGERRVERFGWTFARGDKVMQIENDYDKEVYNGDIGAVVDVDPEAGELTARFEGRDLLYGFGELDALMPAYAATVHKSQGSEYPAVVIPALTQHYAMLKRNLFYTGVTRGKRLVVLVGQKKAVAIAVRNASGRRRWSKLDEWLACATAGTETGSAGDARRHFHRSRMLTDGPRPLEGEAAPLCG